MRPVRTLRRTKSVLNLRAAAAADAGGEEITSANAQGKFPADGALFAANLPDKMSAAEHEEFLHELLDVFGRNWVQIKQDKNGRPFAIVQFDTIEAANDVLRNGQGMVYNGRELRLEKAKVERALIITKADGSRAVTDWEAHNLLSRYGPIDMICSTDMIRKRDTALPRGQYVRFEFWLNCRDALRMFSEHYSGYRIQDAGEMKPIDREYTASGATITTGGARDDPQGDELSIYVGNLPEGTTREELIDIFQRFGNIKGINHVSQQFPEMNNCFAFIEYSTVRQAELACEAQVTIRGTKLRIEPKEYTARRRIRTAQGGPPQSPKPPPAPRPRFAWPERAETRIPTERTPIKIAPEANAALQERLAQNNLDNKAVGGNLGNQAKKGVYTPPHRRGKEGDGNDKNPYSN